MLKPISSISLINQTHFEIEQNNRNSGDRRNSKITQLKCTKRDFISRCGTRIVEKKKKRKRDENYSSKIKTILQPDFFPSMGE